MFILWLCELLPIIITGCTQYRPDVSFALGLGINAVHCMIGAYHQVKFNQCHFHLMLVWCTKLSMCQLDTAIESMMPLVTTLHDGNVDDAGACTPYLQHLL